MMAAVLIWLVSALVLIMSPALECSTVSPTQVSPPNVAAALLSMRAEMQRQASELEAFKEVQRNSTERLREAEMELQDTRINLQNAVKEMNEVKTSLNLEKQTVNGMKRRFIMLESDSGIRFTKLEENQRKDQATLRQLAAELAEAKTNSQKSVADVTATVSTLEGSVRRVESEAKQLHVFWNKTISDATAGIEVNIKSVTNGLAAVRSNVSSNAKQLADQKLALLQETHIRIAQISTHEEQERTARNSAIKPIAEKTYVLRIILRSTRQKVDRLEQALGTGGGAGSVPLGVLRQFVQEMEAVAERLGRLANLNNPPATVVANLAKEIKVALDKIGAFSVDMGRLVVLQNVRHQGDITPILAEIESIKRLIKAIALKG